MKWVVDFNMRDGYVKYIAVDYDISFKMIKIDIEHWKILILNYNIEFEYYGKHIKELVSAEVMKRINEI